MVSADFIHSSMTVLELMVLIVASCQLFLIGRGLLASYTDVSGKPLQITSSRASAPMRNVRSSSLDSVFKVGSPLPATTGRGYLKKQSVMNQNMQG